MFAKLHNVKDGRVAHSDAHCWCSGATDGLDTGMLLAQPPHKRYGLSLSEPREILSISSACMHGVRLSLLSKLHATRAGN
jgi:hypothetical protein